MTLGNPAPDFTLPDQEGRPVSLSSLRGRWVVLYFYPKDDTPGCTAEACGFRDRSAELQAAGAAVLGVSILDSKSKAKFAKKHSLNFPLLADENNEVANLYGVWKEKSMYGRTYFGVSRETFLIDPQGRLAHHWDKAKGSADHADEVLARLAQA